MCIRDRPHTKPIFLSYSTYRHPNINAILHDTHNKLHRSLTDFEKSCLQTFNTVTWHKFEKARWPQKLKLNEYSMDAGAKPASIIIDVHSTCTVPACDVTKLQTHCRLARAYRRSPDPASLVAWRSQFKRQRVLFERKFFEYWSRKISNSSGSSTTLWSHLRSAVSTCLDRYCAQSWQICQVILTHHSCSPVNVWFQPADHQLIGGYSGSIRKNARWSCNIAHLPQSSRLLDYNRSKKKKILVFMLRMTWIRGVQLAAATPSNPARDYPPENVVHSSLTGVFCHFLSIVCSQ